MTTGKPLDEIADQQWADLLAPGRRDLLRAGVATAPATVRT